MKKTYFMAAAASLLLASCAGSGNRSESDSAKVEFEMYDIRGVAEMVDADSLTDNEGWKYCDVKEQGVLPVKIGNKDISQLRDSLERLAAVRFVSPDKVEARLDSTMRMTDLDTVKCCSGYQDILTLSLMTPRLLVWKNLASSYVCAAAHGMYNTTFVNYSIADGKILTISDLMNSGYEKQLTEMIREKIREDKVDLIVPMEEVGIPKDFELTSTGIRFVYTLYEIAPYSAGEVTVDFDAYELEELLKPGMIELIYGN